MQKVQTFRASCMREALTRVKRELGEQAVILGTRGVAEGPLGNLLGRAGVEITATVPDAAAAAPRRMHASVKASQSSALPAYPRRSGSGSPTWPVAPTEPWAAGIMPVSICAWMKPDSPMSLR